MFEEKVDWRRKSSVVPQTCSPPPLERDQLPAKRLDSMLAMERSRIDMPPPKGGVAAFSAVLRSTTLRFM